MERVTSTFFVVVVVISMGKFSSAASDGYDQAGEFKNFAADKAHRTIRLATQRKDGLVDGLSNVASEAYDGAKDHVTNAANEAIDNAKDKLNTTANEAYDNAKDRVNDAVDRAEDRVNDAYDRANDRVEYAKHVYNAITNGVGEKYMSAFPSSWVGIAIILLSFI